MKKYLAEILGTFILTLAISFALAGIVPVAIPVVAALALGVGVYTFGNLSGAHFNPAITLGALAVGKISSKDAILYVCSQMIGAAAASEFAIRLVAVPALEVGDNNFIMLIEMLGTFIFSLGFAAFVFGKTSNGASGLAVGGSYLLGIVIALAGSNGFLNPAVALGVGSFSFSYLLGPIVGATLGMALYKNLNA